MKRIMLVIIFGAFIAVGCATKGSIQEYRSEKIRINNPDWDESTTRKLAAREVEVGMSEDMVQAALGIPDNITREGNEDKWWYAIVVQTGDMGGMRKKFVYFVYFRHGAVVRTAGDRGQLRYLPWR